MAADFQFAPSLRGSSAGLEALSAAKGARPSATRRSGGAWPRDSINLSKRNDPPTAQRQNSIRRAAAIGLQPRLRWINETCFALWQTTSRTSRSGSEGGYHPDVNRWKLA